MFLMQYFWLQGILPFSKSYPEIESTWRTAECKPRKSCDTWYYIATCATFCVSFSSKSKAKNVFPKGDQSIQARKKLFYHVQRFVKVFDQTRRHVEVWNQRTGIPAKFIALLYRGRTVRSSHRSCCVRKLFLKILQTPVLESMFNKVTDL